MKKRNMYREHQSFRGHAQVLDSDIYMVYHQHGFTWKALLLALHIFEVVDTPNINKKTGKIVNYRSELALSRTCHGRIT